jgi:hypothetical protein
MKEGHDFSANGVDPRQVGTFLQITAVASQCQVLGFVGAAMLLGDYVLNVVRQLAVFLRELAILTAIVRATPDEVARGGVHI